MPNIPSIKIGNTNYDIKDTTAREHLIEVSTTPPSSTENRLWIKNAENEYQVPTYEEFSNLKSALSLEADRSMIDMSGFKPGDYAPYKKWDNAGLTHEIHPGIIKINGTSNGGRLVSLLGNDSRYANATTPSENQLSQGPFSIVSGHKYRISLKMVAGTISDTSKMLLELFGTDGTTVIASVGVGEETVFAASVSQIGQFCYFTFKNTTWTNAEFVYEFKDLTDEIEKEKEKETALNNKIAYATKATSGTNDIGRMLIPCENSFVDKTTLTGDKIGNRIVFNGTDLSTSRWFIYETFARGTKTPTYANYPAQYHSACNLFEVGHKYYFGIKIISGSITWTDASEDNHHFYFDLRTQSGGQIGSVNNEIWACTAKPEMIALCNYECVFTNTILELCIYDVTEMNNEYSKLINQYDVPPYFNSQLSTAISKINTDINAGKTENYGTDVESFVFITDVHWATNKKHSPALIKEILNNCPIKTVICGGDFIQGNAGTKAAGVAEIMDFTNAIMKIPCYEYFCVFGNHDDNGHNSNSIDNRLTKDEQYNVLYAPFSNMKNVHWSFEDDTLAWDRTNVIKNDYYVDHPRTKTRFLCVDWNNPMSGDRVTWMENLLSRNDGYRVIVVYHGIYAINNEELEPEHTGIMNVLAPYKAKIAAVITGHAHMDAVVDYYEDGSVPVILTSCDTFRDREGFTEGTVTEQCFDVVVVDYLNGKIKLTRIGRGSNREVNISVTV